MKECIIPHQLAEPQHEQGRFQHPYPIVGRGHQSNVTKVPLVHLQIACRPLPSPILPAAHLNFFLLLRDGLSKHQL